MELDIKEQASIRTNGMKPVLFNPARPVHLQKRGI
jgi:hypothetical protein